MLTKYTTIDTVGFTSEGGLGDFEKKILSCKHTCTRKRFVHTTTAEKKIHASSVS